MVFKNSKTAKNREVRKELSNPQSKKPVVPHNKRPNEKSIDIDKIKLPEDWNLTTWKIIHNNQKDNILFILEKLSYILKDKKKTDKAFRAYSILMETNLFQLMFIESMQPKLQDLSAHSRLVSRVQKVIHNNQNPKICSNIEVNAFQFNRDCGFGCQIHDIAYCMMVSLGEGKPLVIKLDEWKGFQSIYDLIEPLSNTCHYSMIDSHNISAKFIDVKYGFLNKIFIPPVFPTEIKTDLEKFHVSPFVWFFGQIVNYILRLPQKTLENIKPIQFDHPIVGVHIRRTDKLIAEAKYFDIDEYMKMVELYYKKLEMKVHVSKKRVYFSSDVPSLVEDLRRRYPEYLFITSRVITKESRNTPPGVYHTLSDVYHLSLTDYLVCGFSSNMCRLAYEWMNSKHVDASQNFDSLDNIFHFSGQNTTIYHLVTEHSTNNNIIKAGTQVKMDNYGYKRYASFRVNGIAVSIPFFKLKEQLEVNNYKAFGADNMD